jgi:hypothetical protein
MQIIPGAEKDPRATIQPMAEVAEFVESSCDPSSFELLQAFVERCPSLVSLSLFSGQSVQLKICKIVVKNSLGNLLTNWQRF